MKNKILYISIILMLVSLFSCKEDETTMYNSPNGLYFDTDSIVYSFAENFDNKQWGSDTINLLVMVSGDTTPYPRPVEIALLDSKFNTATSDMFELLARGEIPAGKLEGVVPVKLNYKQEVMNDQIFRFKVKLVGNEYFEEQNLFRDIHKIYVTSMVIQPINWSKLKRFFGNYSNSWYSFILTQFDMNYVPYWSGKNNPDPDKYNMSYDVFQSYVAKVRVALEEYNETHEIPLLHEDGEFKGLPVTMN